MIGTCPYDCSNKTFDGYCKTTGCIDLNYQQNQINQNTSVPKNATNGDMIIVHDDYAILDYQNREPLFDRKETTLYLARTDDGRLIL